MPNRRDYRWAASNRPAESRFSVASLLADDGEEDQRGRRRQAKTRMDGGEGSPSPDTPSPVLQVLGGEARCYRCSKPGHRARDFSARVPRCLLCADLGLSASHRMELSACKPPAQKRTRRQEERISGDRGGKKTSPQTGTVRKTRKYGVGRVVRKGWLGGGHGERI